VGLITALPALAGLCVSVFLGIRRYRRESQAEKKLQHEETERTQAMIAAFRAQKGQTHPERDGKSPSPPDSP
jgi:hypothetical protein